MRAPPDERSIREAPARFGIRIDAGTLSSLGVSRGSVLRSRPEVVEGDEWRSWSIWITPLAEQELHLVQGFEISDLELVG